MYLYWYDDDKKKTVMQKLVAALDAYRVRFGYAATTILTNEAERIDMPGIEVRSETYIGKNIFWIGMVYADTTA